MSDVLLFSTCLGLNDSGAIGTQKLDPKTGRTELVDCLNLTTTPDGCIQTVPGMEAVLTHDAAITGLSAGSRLFFQDGTDVHEVVNGAAVRRFPAVCGPIVHTPLDVRVSGASAVYKSANPAGAMTAATVGTNPGPPTSRTYAGMPLFSGGFVFNSRLYAHSGAFLQYSEDYHYDLWDLGNGFIGHAGAILQAGATSGLLVAAHGDGVSVYIGSGPADFVKRFYPCSFIHGTLYSGFIAPGVGYGHVFLCSDGIYLVAQDASLINLTQGSVQQLAGLNDSYTGAVVSGDKYLAWGDNVCIEYDFTTKTVMKRHGGLSGVCADGETIHVAAGEVLSKIVATPATGLASSATLPYSSLGTTGRKSFSDLYFTGEISGGALEIVARDQSEDAVRWSVTVEECGAVQQKRIRVPRGTIGSKVSFQLNMDSGYLRVEELRAVFASSMRRS